MARDDDDDAEALHSLLLLLLLLLQKSLVSVVTSPSSYSNLHVSAASSSLSQSSHTNSSFKFISIQLRATEVKSMCSVERGKGTISTSPETSPNVVARSSKNTVNPLSIDA